MGVGHRKASCYRHHGSWPSRSGERGGRDEPMPRHLQGRASFVTPTTSTSTVLSTTSPGLQGHHLHGDRCVQVIFDQAEAVHMSRMSEKAYIRSSNGLQNSLGVKYAYHPNFPDRCVKFLPLDVKYAPVG